MKNMFSKFSSQHTIVLLFLVLILGICGRIILGLQGVDSVDAGYSQVFYMAIFDNPDGNAFNFVHLTVGILGGIVEQFFPNGGVLAFRIVEAFGIAIAILSLSMAFRPFVSKKYLLPVAAMLCICYPTLTISLHYNTATYMFFSIALLCLSKAMESGNLKWLFCMGFVYMLALGCRITNVITAPLLLIPLSFYYYKNKNVALPFLLFSFGAVSSALLLLLVVFLFSDINSLFTGIDEARSFANAEEVTHSLPNLIITYLLSCKNWIIQLLVIFVLHYLYKFVSNATSGKTRIALTIFLYIGFVVNVWCSNSYLSIFAIGLYVIFLNLKKQKAKDFLQDKQFVLCAFSVLSASLFPFGSDTGFGSVFHWLTGLVVFPACTYLKPNNKTVVAILFFTISVVAVMRNISRLYDSFTENRLEATTWSNVDRLNLYLAKEESEYYDYHVALINKYKKDSKYMLLGSQESMLYYITKTYPFTGHSMPSVYTKKTLYSRLEARKEKLHELPFVYVMKTDTTAREINGCILEWMKQYDYQQVYEDEKTAIYRTKSSIKDKAPQYENLF